MTLPITVAVWMHERRLMNDWAPPLEFVDHSLDQTRFE